MNKNKFLAACVTLTATAFIISMVCAAIWAGVLVWGPRPTATSIIESTVSPASSTPALPTVSSPTADALATTARPTDEPTIAPSATPLPPTPFSPTQPPIVALLPLWTSTPASYPGPTVPPPQPTAPPNEPIPTITAIPSATTCALDWSLPVSWENYDALFGCFRLIYGDPPRWDAPLFCPPAGSAWASFAEFNYGVCQDTMNGTPYAHPTQESPMPTEVH